MYAIIESGGQQFRVSKDDIILVNKISGKKGDKVDFDKVLLTKNKSINVGAPYLSSAKVVGVILAQKKGKKVLVGKHKRRKDYQKITGFRPEITEIRISSVKE